MSVGLGLLGWWQGRSRREQVVLLGGVLALTVLLLWMGLWQPLQAYAKRQQAALEAGQAELAEVRRLAERLASRPTATGAAAMQAPLPALAAVEQAAAGHRLGAALPRREPDGLDRIRLTVQAAEFSSLLGFIAELEQQHGLQIRQFELSPVLEVGRPAGRVSGRLSLVRPSR